MNEERKDIKAIFSEAIAKHTPEERSAYLDKVCGQNSDLRARVEKLIRAHEQAGSFLDISEDPNVTLDDFPHIEGPGTKIGHYELLELIGEGGMGLVYLAEQKEPVRRKVALKIIKPGMDSRQVIARFEAERQALAVLDHPNIARVFDAGTTQTGRPYFIMEYVKGLSITSYCDQNKLSIEKRLRLFEEVCEGIHHAHQKGIIHRDLKPSNILISVHGDRAVPKIIDFGIAKAITQPLTDKTFVTFQGQLLGTPEYMSPEQVDLATQDIDIRSDIYSLGVVLYELLAGVLPFERESLARLGFAEVQRTIREQEPATPSVRLTKLGEEAKTIAASRGTQAVALARRLYRELEWIPLKAMRKDRCRRYKSASEMADDIRNYLNGNPLTAGPETAMYRVQKFVHKHAGSVATVALVAVAIVLGLIVSTAMYFRSEKALEREAVARVQAEDAKDKETAARTRAEQAKEQEALARTQAEQAEQVAKEKAEELRQTLYVNSIQLADAKYREGNIGHVRKLLESCHQDLRGWEWNRINHVLDHSVMSFVAHKGPVRSMSLSPNGKYAVTGGDNAIRLWDLTQGKEPVITSQIERDWWTHCVSFSPDGKRIVSGDSSGEIRVWNTVNTNKEIISIKHGDDWISSVAFSPDGKHILSATYFDEMIRVWDAQTGAEEIAFRGNQGGVSCAIFSPDGKNIVSAGWDGVIKIWDATVGNEVMQLTGHDHIIDTVSFSSEGKLLASGSNDTIKIWNTTTGTMMTTFQGHDGPVRSVAFSPDDRYLVSGGDDCTVRIWDIKTKEQIKVLRGHEHQINFVAFTRDSKQIVSGSADGTVKIWDVTIDLEIFIFTGHRDGVASTAFSPNGKRLVSRSDDGKVKVWDVASGAEVMTFRGGVEKGYYFDSIEFSPDGKQIASLSKEHRIMVWDIETGTEVTTLGGQDERILCLAFSLEGKQIVSGNDNGEIKVWNLKENEEITKFDGESPVISIVFSPDGKRIVSGHKNGKVIVWDAESGVKLMNLIGHEEEGIVRSLAFSPDGMLIASACDKDRTAKIWNAKTGMEIATLQGHGDSVYSVVFSPDGKRLVTGSRDRTARIWDSSTGDELLTLPAHFYVSSVAFSPDGKTIAGATWGKTVMLWESAAPDGGYEPRKTAEVARKIVDELYEEHGFYFKVINELEADKTLDESIRKVALQIAKSRQCEDEEEAK